MIAVTDNRIAVGGARQYGRIALTALASAVAACALWLAPAASADLTFCSSGDAEHPAFEAESCNKPRGIATDFETGRVYVADQGNKRINVFQSDGAFLFAFGWGVDTGASELQTCTMASGCQAGIEGTGAGQLKPISIAVDNAVGSASRHDIYVLDAIQNSNTNAVTNARVEKFEPDGSFVSAFGWGVDTGAAKLESCTAASGCQAGISGPGECQISDTRTLIAVGPGGNVFVADSAESKSQNFTDRVEKFTVAGACGGETPLPSGQFVRLSALAIDGAEDAWVSVEGPGEGLRKYDLATGAKLCAPESGSETGAMAIDDAGALFVAQTENRQKHNTGSFKVLSKYNTATCAIESRFGYGKLLKPVVYGIAALHTVTGDIVSSEASIGVNEGLVHHLTEPQPGPIVALPSVSASPRSVWAAIEAEINPEGAETHYSVDYVDQHSYETEGGFASPNTRTGPVEMIEGEDFHLHAVEAIAGCHPFTQSAFEEGKCLEPEAVYRYRIRATNPDNPSGSGEASAEGSFAAKAPIEVSAIYATGVGADTATLNAEVNPLGIPASGYFEYVDDAAYEADLEGGGDGFAVAIRAPDTAAGAAPLDFGASEDDIVVHSAPLYPLSAGTTYHYRLVSTNTFLSEPAPSALGMLWTFAAPGAQSCPANEAFRTGPSALLPDCRAYEMVSPLDKSNGDVIVLKELQSHLPAVLNQSATSGGRLAYGSMRAFPDSQSSPTTVQYIASRDADGWSNHSISSPIDKAIEPKVSFDTEFRAFSKDLCESWLTPFADPTLAPGALPGFYNIYRRRDQDCGGPAYEALTTMAPEHLLGAAFETEIQGVSADGETLVFVANDSFVGSGAPANAVGKSQLYARSGGELRFLCVLPGGAPTSEPCVAGGDKNAGGGKNYRKVTVAGALSADGRRVFWTAPGAPGRIYVRENPFGEGAECSDPTAPCTVAVSKAAEKTAGTSGSRWWAAADDGSAAIFTTGGRLYEFDVDSATTSLIAEGVAGVVGASQDASRVYFVSTKALSGEEENGVGDKAEEGKPNLYLHEDGEGSGTLRYIGTLAGGDVSLEPGIAKDSLISIEPGTHNARVSPDGRHLAFMSEAPLTGADNTDASSAARCGAPGGICDSEVYLYDAAAGRLVCASCNPSGARPVGVNLRAKEAALFWVAGQIPGWENTLYAARVLSDDGSRLYFESTDALSPRDSNGRKDVYQWEAAGSGGCSAAEPTYSELNGGCVDLVSSGQSRRDSEFIDASPSGDDVFFTTLAGLVPEDYGLVDVYDARAGGGLPSPEKAPASCEGEACQGPYSPPTDPTPASSSFEGAGNVREGASAGRRSCAMDKLKKGGKCVAKKHAKRHKQAKHKRRAGR